MKNSNDAIGNRTRDLPACSAVPQPTVLQRAPCKIKAGPQKEGTIRWVRMNHKILSCNPVLLHKIPSGRPILLHSKLSTGPV